MQDPRKLHYPPSNVVYEIDGTSYGVDDDLVEAIKGSIGRRLASKTLDVPRLPQVAARILELSGNPDTGVDEVAEAVSTDPILASRLLAIANSAAYGVGIPVEGLEPALLRLGTKLVKDTVFAESIRLRIFSARNYRPILEQSWKRSLGTAIACEALSVATGVERDGAFLLGLLHDTGTPVLVNAISEHEHRNRGLALGTDVVETLIAELHEEVGAHVLSEWGMPPSIVGAARSHHHYQGATRSTPACRLVFAGNLVCRHLGIGEKPRSVNFTIEHAFADLGVNESERIAPILESVARDFEALMSGLHEA